MSSSRTVSSITDEQITHVFHIFDADGSGFIEVEELGFAMQAAGVGALSKETIDQLVKSFCPASTVQINIAEFTKMVRQRSSERNSVEDCVRSFGIVLANAAGGVVPEGKYTVTVDDLMAAAKVAGELPEGDAASELRWRRIFTQAVASSETDSVGSSNEGINLATWIRMMQDSVSEKRRRVIHDTSSYSIQSRAKVAKRGPYGVRLEEGTTYYYCTCGMSKNQPFCDGSHNAFNIANGSNFEPIAFTAPETKTVWLCGCKQSKTLPYCDGTHSSLPSTE